MYDTEEREEELRAKGAPSDVILLLTEFGVVGVVGLPSLPVTPPGGLVFGGTS